VSLTVTEKIGALFRPLCEFVKNSKIPLPATLGVRGVKFIRRRTLVDGSFESP